MANADSSVRLFQQHESESVDTALPVCIPCSVVVQKGWRCSQGLFASSIILNGSCCLVLVTIWKSRHSSTAMVSYLSIPGSQMCPLGYFFVSPNPDVPRVLFVRPWTGAMRVSKRWFLLVWCHLMCEFFEVVLVLSHGLLVLLSDTSIHDGLWQRLHLWIIANLLLYLFNGKGSKQAGLHNSLNELFCLLLQACFWCVCQIFCQGNLSNSLHLLVRTQGWSCSPGFWDCISRFLVAVFFEKLSRFAKRVFDPWW